MNTRIIIYPYKIGSASAKKIAQALDATRVHADKDYHPKNGDVIFDWGNGWEPKWAEELESKNVLLLNHWKKISLSVNKLDTFNLLRKYDVPHPEWTKDEKVAKKWLAMGHWVCCRTNVEGMDGAGLILAKTLNDFAYAQLYTKYMPIANEYRVYVFDDEMLDIRHKRRDQDMYDAGKINEYIRTTSGGWLFCQHGFTTPPDAGKVAVAAAKALGLNFAGVDIIQAKEDKKCYVLETNTAPYIGDNTVDKLVTAVLKRQKEFIKNL